MEQQDRPEVVPGQHIFLTTLRREDVPVMAQWVADLETTAYMGQIGASFSIEQEQEWFDNLRRSSDITFGIVVRESRRLIGSISLMRIDAYHGRAELGITIGEKSAWGRGYGSEAVRLMLNTAASSKICTASTCRLSPSTSAASAPIARLASKRPVAGAKPIRSAASATTAFGWM